MTSLDFDIQYASFFGMVTSSTPEQVIAEHVVSSLIDYGWAIIDNFIGHNYLCSIYHEINGLYSEGVFSAGQLMATRDDLGAQSIRSDQIYWFDNDDRFAKDLATTRLLIAMIDKIVIEFDSTLHCNIKGRSRAMLSVYPAHGSHYVKHVDNPLNDGRCVTSIYYCNPNWNAAIDGGCFRLYPELSPEPLDIEPRGDRLVFFWSDHRNPHEVRPVYRDRYAVTIWYFDHDKAAAAIRKKQTSGTSKRGMATTSGL